MGFGSPPTTSSSTLHELLYVALPRLRWRNRGIGGAAGKATRSRAGRNGIATCEMMLRNMAEAASSRRTTTGVARRRHRWRCAAARSDQRQGRSSGCSTSSARSSSTCCRPKIQQRIGTCSKPAAG